MQNNPDIPADFDSFWKQNVNEALTHPLKYNRTSSNFYKDSHVIDQFCFEDIDNKKLFGWIAIPKNLSSKEKRPAFLWLPPYGRSSVLPNEYGTREGYASMSFNFHGYEAFHEEKYEKENGYYSQGIESKNTWILKKLFQNSLIATRILSSLREVDSNRIASMGLSQGAGISLWLGTWCPLIKAVASDLCFLGDIKKVLSERVFRYPTKELTDFIADNQQTREKVYETLNYFDTTHIATRCQIPTLMSLGLRDPAARPDNVRAIYNALNCPKKLIEYNWGHDWHPEMVQNNLDWLNKNL